MNIIFNLVGLFVSLVFCYVIYLLREKFNFTFASVIALFIGIVLGLLFKGHTVYMSVLGTIYTKTISMMVIPLLGVSLIKSIYAMKSLTELKKIGAKALFWLLFQTLLAAITGTVIALLSGIGKGSHLSIVNGFKVDQIPSFTQVITDLFSNNLFSSMAEGKVLPVVFFAIMIGISVVVLSENHGESMTAFKGFIDDCHQIIYHIIRFIIHFLPYSIIFLLADTVGTSDLTALKPLLTIILLTFIGCFFHIYVTGSLLLKLISKKSPRSYFKNILPAQLMAFSSRSSSGTIPLYVECLTKKEGVSESIANFVASLGTTVGMSGCAGIWPPLLSIYAMHSLGMDVTFVQIIVLIILCPIISLGTAGVPGGGIMLATAMFVTLGLPVEIVSIFAGIDAFVDMARTTTNVTSSMIAATLVTSSEQSSIEL